MIDATCTCIDRKQNNTDTFILPLCNFISVSSFLVFNKDTSSKEQISPKFMGQNVRPLNIFSKFMTLLKMLTKSQKTFFVAIL